MFDGSLDSIDESQASRQKQLKSKFMEWKIEEFINYRK